jgi:hypothetical protein
VRAAQWLCISSTTRGRNDLSFTATIAPPDERGGDRGDEALGRPSD